MISFNRIFIWKRKKINHCIIKTFLPNDLTLSQAQCPALELCSWCWSVTTASSLINYINSFYQIYYWGECSSCSCGNSLIIFWKDRKHDFNEIFLVIKFAYTNACRDIFGFLWFSALIWDQEVQDSVHRSMRKSRLKRATLSAKWV